MFDIESMMPFVYVILGVMVFGMVFNTYIKPMLEKRKKGEKIDVPRDSQERSVKNTKKPLKYGYNLELRGMRLWFSGDEIIDGSHAGYVRGIIPYTHGYLLFVRKSKYNIFGKVLSVMIPPELITDLNGMEGIIEGRGYKSSDENFTSVLPCYGYPVEQLEVYNSMWQLDRILEQFDSDIKSDTDWIPKTALRGKMQYALKELDKLVEMQEIEKEKANTYLSLLRKKEGSELDA